jgi:hypothetical protein
MKPFLSILCLLIASSAIAQELQEPAAGTPARKAILDGLREADVLHGLASDWKAKIVFSHVVIRKVNDWAWVVASPQTEDGKQMVEPVTCVMHTKSSHWRVVEFIPDDVAPADYPEVAYQKWRAGFLSRHRDCPPKIFPATFD